MIKDNTERFQDALKADLGRPPIESDLYVLMSSFDSADDLTHCVIFQDWTSPPRSAKQKTHMTTSRNVLSPKKRQFCCTFKVSAITLDTIQPVGL